MTASPTPAGTKVLVLGAGGMLGHAVLRRFLATPGIDVHGTVRARDTLKLLEPHLASVVTTGVDAGDVDGLVGALSEVKPDMVVNCIGLVKQREAGNDPMTAIAINALFPHRLARLCGLIGARLIHFSTDCVFDGTRGDYREADACTAEDVYGLSKRLGELDAPYTVTLRTSMIGPELSAHRGLLAWFLAQKSAVKGFRRAIFSGVTTRELARIVSSRVIPRPDLHGLYHVGAEPISKFDLLTLIGQIYGHTIPIEPDDTVVIDRSLDSSRFRAATGYRAPSWRQMIAEMRDDSDDN